MGVRSASRPRFPNELGVETECARISDTSNYAGCRNRLCCLAVARDVNSDGDATNNWTPFITRHQSITRTVLVLSKINERKHLKVDKTRTAADFHRDSTVSACIVCVASRRQGTGSLVSCSPGADGSREQPTMPTNMIFYQFRFHFRC